MSILTVKNLTKTYPAFKLNGVSFEVNEGEITGYIGRNGAGKTTTLRCLLDLVHPDSGEIEFFGKSFRENQFEIKQMVGFAAGEVDYYPRKKLSAITDVTRRFYRDWNEKAYERYMSLFNLSDNKTPSELSSGMKVKYSLALALSHNAKLLILDEPASGLDPISRDELLDVFNELVRREGISIFFSTHITSDLEKCADNIIYIRQGEIPYKGTMKGFVDAYRLVRFESEPKAEGLIGLKREKDSYTALIKAEDTLPEGATEEKADIESVMVHLEHKDVWSEEGGEDK